MKTTKLKVRKDLQNTTIRTMPGIVVDNNYEYDAITVFHDDNEICIESTCIYIQDEWHQINNIDFE